MEASDILGMIIESAIWINVFALYGFYLFLAVRLMIVVPRYLRKISEKLDTIAHK